MVVRIYKLKENGDRYKSYTVIPRVTKLEQFDNILYVHTYFSDYRGHRVESYNLDDVGIDIFAGRN